LTKNSTAVKNDTVVMAATTIKNDSIANSDINVKNLTDGLIIRGSVAGRTKRIVGDKNIELVTYKIAAGANIYFIKDWAPKDYFPVGKSVELPIGVKPYLSNGHVRIDYTICNNPLIGEEF